MYGWPLLDGIIALAVMGLMMESSQNEVRLPKTPALWLCIGLFIATITSHFPTFYFQGILNTIPESFKYCFFCALLIVVINSLDRARAVIFVFVAAALIMTFHALMQQRLGYGFAGLEPLLEYRPKTDEWQVRSYFFGIFGDPNDLAQFLAASIPLVFALPRRMNAIMFSLCMGVAWYIFMGLEACHSRGGMISLMTIGMCLVFLKLPIRWLPYAGVLALLGFLVLCAVKGSVLLDESARERVVFWGMANRVFKTHPIFGIGYGMFWQVIPQSRGCHNAFVSCYTEIGLFGYWFWFSILQLGVIGGWRTLTAFKKPRTGSQKYIKRLSGLSVAAICGFSAGAYFLSRAFVFPYFFLFGLLCAIPITASQLLPEDHPPLVSFHRDVLGFGTWSTLFSIVYIYVSILILNKGYG